MVESGFTPRHSGSRSWVFNHHIKSLLGLRALFLCFAEHARYSLQLDISEFSTWVSCDQLYSRTFLQDLGSLRSTS